MAASVDHPEEIPLIRDMTEAFSRFKNMHSVLAGIQLDQSAKAKILFGMYELGIWNDMEALSGLILEIRNAIGQKDWDDARKLTIIQQLCDIALSNAKKRT
jgi:hypothetical protein